MLTNAKTVKTKMEKKIAKNVKTVFFVVLSFFLLVLITKNVKRFNISRRGSAELRRKLSNSALCYEKC